VDVLSFGCHLDGTYIETGQAAHRLHFQRRQSHCSNAPKYRPLYQMPIAVMARLSKNDQIPFANCPNSGPIHLIRANELGEKADVNPDRRLLVGPCWTGMQLK
ncbi:hypothetical protein, partial [Agrobacterium sp. MCAB5]|uniref:hypothetical protein n=1 Tax=Agrobacterium sp. MCAB5 TaxID=3233042 RepID=UPI003F9326F5